jgi:hypothetical protein
VKQIVEADHRAEVHDGEPVDDDAGERKQLGRSEQVVGDRPVKKPIRKIVEATNNEDSALTHVEHCGHLRGAGSLLLGCRA